MAGADSAFWTLDQSRFVELRVQFDRFVCGTLFARGKLQELAYVHDSDSFLCCFCDETRANQVCFKEQKHYIAKQSKT